MYKPEQGFFAKKREIQKKDMQLDKQLDDSTLEGIAELICGDDMETKPVYRSGNELTCFFRRAGLYQFQHDGSTRKLWTLDSLRTLSTSRLPINF